MSTIVEDFKKALQDFLAPELEELKGEMRAINIRLESMEKLAEVRFAAIMRELAIDKRLDKLERESAAARPS